MAYFKVFELAEDEHGNPGYAGMAMSINVSDSYDGHAEITNAIDIAKLAETLNLKPENIIPITAEEYERDYAYADEDADDSGRRLSICRHKSLLKKVLKRY